MGNSINEIGQAGPIINGNNTIGGGDYNQIIDPPDASGNCSANTIGGGDGNVINPELFGHSMDAHGTGHCVIPGGFNCVCGNHFTSAMGMCCKALGYGSVAIGDTNEARAMTSVVVGGGHNTIETACNGAVSDPGMDAADAAIIGGFDNRIHTGGEKGAIIGGSQHENSGFRSIILGGIHAILSIVAKFTFVFGDCDGTIINVDHAALFFPNGTPGRMGINKIPDDGYALDVNGAARFSIFDLPVSQLPISPNPTFWPPLKQGRMVVKGNTIYVCMNNAWQVLKAF